MIQGESHFVALLLTVPRRRIVAAILTGLCCLAETYGQPGVLPRSPEAGMPRPWEAGLQVARHSVVNLFNGNMITVIPIFRCDPVGPPLEFNLYHNSASADSQSGLQTPWGFDLGGGWSVSYGSSIVTTAQGATLIEDDGNEWNYTLVNGEYVPPPGKFDLLGWDSQASQWTLTRPDQTKRIFDDQGRLIQEIDSAGNVLTIVRDPYGRLERIQTAADGLPDVDDHRITFTYDGTGKLEMITDMIGRDFRFFYYPADGRLRCVNFPKDPGTTLNVIFQYDTRNRIVSYQDKLTSTQDPPSAWSFTYANDRLATVTDPAPFSYVQGFGFPARPVDGLWQTLYTDRRGYVWDYRFDNDGNLRRTIDPLAKVRQFTYDAQHNRLTFTNELAKTWTMTYGPVGNVTSVTTPLPGPPAQTWTYTWQDNVNGIANFSRLVQVTDPAGHWVQYEYDESDPIDPTLVVLIREMDPDGPGPGTESVTTLEYWDAPSARGQLKLVTDANGVQHEFTYDAYGYSDNMREGLLGAMPLMYPVEQNVNRDAAGRTTGGSDDAGSGDICLDDADNETCAQCAPLGPPGYPLRLGFSPAPEIAPFLTCSGGNTFNPLGQPTAIYANCLTAPWGSNIRQFTAAYDALGRVVSATITSNEQWTPGGVDFPARTFAYPVYDPEGRVTQRDGPDGQTTAYAYDPRGLLQTVSRSGLSVTHHYDAAARLERSVYGNGNTTYYVYDEANRLKQIRHENGAAVVLYRLDYTYAINDVVLSRSEYDSTAGLTSIVTFTYDDRDRLTREVRTGTSPYDLSYTYDPLGNRLSKVDASDPQNIVQTTYYYDSDPANRDPFYPTNNNRLLWYEVRTNVGEPEEALARVVRYTYYKTGHASNVTIADLENPLHRYDLALYYARNGTLRLAVWGGYDVDTEGGYVAGSYVANAAREFRYDHPRARYMSRSIDVSASDHEPCDPSSWTPIAPAAWTDYDGVMPYGDFDLDVDASGNGVITEKARYAGGFGTFGRRLLDAQGQVAETRYLLGDLIRSTNLTTDGAGAAAQTVAYTAFGEIAGDDGQGRTRIGADPPAGFPRYQYAGGWGYEADLLTLAGAPTSPLPPVRLLHVGARWYQPDIGRFVMRDPIGIEGGLNGYAYCEGNPVVSADPNGHQGSLAHPEGVIALLEGEMAQGGGKLVVTLVARDGTTRVVTITAISVIEKGADKMAKITAWGEKGKEIICWAWKAGAKFDGTVDRLPGGGLVIRSGGGGGGGACGAIGLEAAPFLVLLDWQRRRRRHGRPLKTKGSHPGDHP